MPSSTTNSRNRSSWIAERVHGNKADRPARPETLARDGDELAKAATPKLDGDQAPTATDTDAPPPRATPEGTAAAINAATPPHNAGASSSGPVAKGAASTAPPIGEKQGSARFQVRLTPTLAEVVEANVGQLELETGLTRNQIRQIAVWAILGSSTDGRVIDAFVHNVIPDWNHARNIATEQHHRRRLKANRSSGS